MLIAKERNGYGRKVANNVGVFQGPSISALLFVIYLGDVMQDYNELNGNKNIPKNTPERCITEQIILEIQHIKDGYAMTTKQKDEMIVNLKTELLADIQMGEPPETCLRKIKRSIQKTPKKSQGGTTIKETDLREYDADAVVRETNSTTPALRHSHH